MASRGAVGLFEGVTPVGTMAETGIEQAGMDGCHLAPPVLDLAPPVLGPMGGSLEQTLDESACETRRTGGVK